MKTFGRQLSDGTRLKLAPELLNRVAGQRKGGQGEGGWAGVAGEAEFATSAGLETPSRRPFWAYRLKRGPTPRA